MLPNITLFTAAAGLLQFTRASSSASPVNLKARQYRTQTLEGCYSSTGGAELNSTNLFNTDGYCQQMCYPLEKAVVLLSEGTKCWCGDLLPNNATLVSDSKCNVPCTGDEDTYCGGYGGYYTVWNDGYLLVEPDEAPLSTSSTSSSISSTSATSSKSAAQTTSVVTTAPAATSSTSSSGQDSSTNVAAVAAGTSVTLVALAAIGAGVFVFLRSKKRREIEEEHKKSAAQNSAFQKPPLSAGSSFNSPLDPVVMARRQSDGSIADNQDYSRRILKVCTKKD
ncbi:hypothetical protein BJ878DRAFT_533893 [Calycina marina]|uniref:WSC domain-containing protein n=1 Tax=Calycina marina TaxID=1763456 RepID=A0A9P7Z4Y3_9HELO|nr:hypothetical protein BJ878DRAFT_533893 [Calycina marina]